MLPFVEDSCFWKSCKLQDCKGKTQTHKLLDDSTFWLSSLEYLRREYKIPWTHSTNQSLIGRSRRLKECLIYIRFTSCMQKKLLFLEIYFEVFFDIDYMIICSYLEFGIFIANGVWNQPLARIKNYIFNNFEKFL